jgi:hypothetical protein
MTRSVLAVIRPTGWPEHHRRSYEKRANARRTWPHRCGARPAEHVPAHRRLRIPVELRAKLPGRTQRRGRMAVPAAPRCPERLRGPAGPDRGHVPVGSRHHAGPSASPVRTGDDGAGNNLADPDGVDDRPGLPGRRPGPARGTPTRLPSRSGRFRSRRRARPDRYVHQRPSRGGRELRAALQLRIRQRHMELFGRGLRRDDHRRPGGEHAARPGEQHPARRAGRPLLRPHDAHPGTVGVRHVVMGGFPGPG